MPIHKTVLDHGVRVLVEPLTHVHSAAIGLWCRTGSRHETEQEAGITHFIEHMLFKGTESRTAKQLAESIEGRGGLLNAFTDKEQTCYYCRVLSDDAANGIEILSDMLTHSLLDAEELGREKGVVLEEIKRSEDEPGDHVHEIHLQKRWGQHPLGKPVIGTSESVSSFQRDDLVKYMERRYRADNIVLAVAGNVDPEAVVAQARELLGGFAAGGEAEPMAKPGGQAQKTEVAKDVEQVHFCIGTESVSLYDDEIYTCSVLDMILGGGMSSRLFQEVRERRGLAYAIGSYNLPYSAGGAFTVYGGTGRQTWEQVQEVVRGELNKLAKDGPTDDEITRAKVGLRGNILLALEGMNARMMRMAKNEINFQRDIPIEETIGKIEAVTHARLVEMAQRMFTDELISTTAIGPFSS